MTNADRIEIESDERGFELHVWVDEEPVVHDSGLMVLNIHGIDLDAFYDQVKARLGPYLREAAEARTAVSRGVSLKEYLADEYRHEVSTGQHAPFLCAVDDIDESGGLAADDPKSPGYHDRVVSIWDDRDKFSEKV